MGKELNTMQLVVVFFAFALALLVSVFFTYAHGLSPGAGSSREKQFIDSRAKDTGNTDGCGQRRAGLALLRRHEMCWLLASGAGGIAA